MSCQSVVRVVAAKQQHEEPRKPRTQSEQHTRHEHRFDRAALIARLLVAVVTLGLTLGVTPTHANPITVGQAAKAVVAAIGGLTAWVESNTDDCAVATLGAAWGTDCNLKQRECQKTGYYDQFCDSTAENSCAYGNGFAYAEEHAAGSYWGYEVRPRAFASAKPLHQLPNNKEDKHKGRGWARASVDGQAETRTDETPDSLTDPSGPAGAPMLPHEHQFLTEWPEGTVLAIVTVDTIQVQARSFGPESSSTLRLVINGEEIFSSTVMVDGMGTVTTDGAIPASSFATTFDALEDKWDVALYDYTVEIPIDTLDTSMAADSLLLHVQFEGECDANDMLIGPGVPPVPVPADLAMIRQNDPNGVPVMMGEYVQLPMPVVVQTDSPVLSHALLDNDVTDGFLGLGIHEMFLPPMLQQGELINLVGQVNHIDGRTVLTDIMPMPIMQGQPVPPPFPVSAGDVAAMGESFEGMRVEMCDMQLVDPAAWPGPQQSAVVQVQDTQGDFIDLHIAGTTGIGGPPPVGLFGVRGIVTQSQPNAPYHGGYALRLTYPEDVFQCATQSVESAGVPGRTGGMLAQNEPNPFNPSTTISFELAQAGGVHLQVFSAEGRLVRTLASGQLNAGTHSVSWDGTGDGGTRMSSGVYFYSLETGGQRQTRKMLMVK